MIKSTESFQLERSNYFLFLGMICAMPIFFTIDNGIDLAPRLNRLLAGKPVFPLSAFAVPILLLIGFRLFNWRVRSFDVIVMCIIALMTLSVAYGFFSGRIDNINYSVLRYVQSVIPMIYLLAFRRIISGCLMSSSVYSEYKSIYMFFVSFALTNFIFLVLYVGQTILFGNDFRFSMVADHIGPFYNYKMLRFYPVFMAISSPILFYASTKLNGIKSIFFIFAAAFSAAGVFLVWSRTALLILMISYGILILFIYLKGGFRFRPSLIVLSCSVMVAMLVAGMSGSNFGSNVSVDRLVGTFEAVLSGEGLGEGDIIRLQRINRAIELGIGRPLGDNFASHEQINLPGRQLWVAENGYLDVAVRAGPFAMVLFIISVTVAAYGSLRAINKKGIGSLALMNFVVLLPLMLIGNNFLHMYSESYTNMLFMFVIALGSSLNEI